MKIEFHFPVSSLSLLCKLMKNIFRDPELYAIVLFNGLLLYTYLTDISGLDTVVMLFYVQNLFIGLQYLIRQIASGLRRKEGSLSSRFGLPLFFVVHYGAFHLFYLVFLLPIVNRIPGYVNIDIFWSGVLYMCLNLIFSLRSDLTRDKLSEAEPVGLMFIPYARVFPMHIFIILAFGRTFGNDGGSLVSVALLFISLKIIADVIMHVIVNKTWRVRPKTIIGDIA